MDNVQVKNCKAKTLYIISVVHSSVCLCVCGVEGIVMHRDPHAPGTVPHIILCVFAMMQKRTAHTQEMVFQRFP